jgi:hypothetical protein
MVDRGKLRIRVGIVLPPAEAREAHFILEGQRLAPTAGPLLGPIG